MRHVIGLAAAISATIAFWAVTPAARADAETDCRQHSDSRLQIRGCSEVIRHDPKASWALKLRASAHAQERDYDRAIADFSAAIELVPRHSGSSSQPPQTAAALFWLSSCYLDRGRLYLEGKREYDHAIADFNELIRLDQSLDRKYKSAALGFVSRGRAYFLKGDADRGIADFRKAFELDPKSHSLSLYYSDYDDYERVASELSEAIKLRPDEAILYVWRGSLYGSNSARKGMKHDRAIADFSAAIRLDPGMHWAYRDRAEMFHLSGDYEHAIADISEAIRLKPSLNYYHQRSDLHSAKGDHDRAIADLSEAIRLQPEGRVYYPYYERRGDMYRAKGDYDGAIADYTLVLVAPAESSESRAATLGKRAKTYFLKGDYRRAIADYEEALQASQEALNASQEALKRLRATR
jgi:tetratricopeptide (TPR) repeat protein